MFPNNRRLGHDIWAVVCDNQNVIEEYLALFEIDKSLGSKTILFLVYWIESRQYIITILLVT